MTAIRQKIGRVGLRTRGTWTNNPSEPYMTLDVVNKDGSSYISEVDNNTSIPPSASWQIMSQRGESGLGVPVGGTTGQVLKKKSNTDFDTEWSSDNAPVLSVNGKTGEVTLNASDVGALPSSTKYGATIDMSLNTTDYKLTVSLKDQDGTVLNSKVVDFPVESVVVNGSYDSTNKKIVLTLQNGNTIDVPVGDIVAGLQSEITALNMLDADLVDDTNSTHKFVTTSEKSTWNGKYDKPASGIPATDLAAGVIPDISGKADKSEMSVVDGTDADADKTTITLKSGTSATVLKSHQDISGKQDTLVSGTNIKTINNESVLGSGNINIVTELPSNLAYTSNDNGEGIIPSDGIRAESVTSAATMSINPDVVTVIDGAVGTAAITLQVPNDNLAHVWDILLTTDSTVAITFAMSNSATILTPNGFSIGASKAVEISVIGVGTKYYLRYGEFA